MSTFPLTSTPLSAIMAASSTALVAPAASPPSARAFCYSRSKVTRKVDHPLVVEAKERFAALNGGVAWKPKLVSSDRSVGLGRLVRLGAGKWWVGDYEILSIHQRHPDGSVTIEAEVPIGPEENDCEMKRRRFRLAGDTITSEDPWWSEPWGTPTYEELDGNYNDDDEA